MRERDLEKLEARIGRAKQSQNIEVAQGAIFMEQNMRFWLILGAPVDKTKKKEMKKLGRKV